MKGSASPTHSPGNITPKQRKLIHSQQEILIIVFCSIVESCEICHGARGFIVNPIQLLCKWQGASQTKAFVHARLSSVTMKQCLANTGTLQQQPAEYTRCSSSEPRGSESAQSQTSWQQVISHLPPELLCTLVCFRRSYCGKWAGLNMKQEEMLITAAHCAIFSLVRHSVSCRERQGVVFNIILLA